MEWPLLSGTMEQMHSRPSQLAKDELKKNQISKVLVCGVSYKPDNIISDVRDAPQKEFVETLIGNNVQVDYYDPLVASYWDYIR
eukprot:Awhi_evm1s6910